MIWGNKIIYDIQNFIEYTVRGRCEPCTDDRHLYLRQTRVDTHEDNYAMQEILEKQGFVCCGNIYLTEDHSPRLAYKKCVPQTDKL